EVRVLYDDVGSRFLRRKYIRSLRNAGVHVEAFFPPKIPNLNFKFNYRNHRKLAIIDGKIGYIGGFNIGDEYLGESKKFGYWRDTHLRRIGRASCRERAFISVVGGGIDQERLSMGQT